MSQPNDTINLFPCPEIPSNLGDQKLLGLYKQIQEGRWLQRLKNSGGRLTGRQWRKLAEIVREFTPKTPLHLTTRQDIEIHDLQPEQIPSVQAELGSVGLTTFGAAGDTPRNTIVCPCSGTVTGTADLSLLAKTLEIEMAKIEGIYSLPRKFKISLSCSETCGQPWIQDLGLVTKRNGMRMGFKVIVAGSLGAKPNTGILFKDWLEAGDVVPLVIAAIKVFATHGDRENRRKARLRHVRERMGDAVFLNLLQETFTETKAELIWPTPDLDATESGFDEQKILTFPNGDISPEMAEALGDLADDEDLRVAIDTHHRVVIFARSVQNLELKLSKFPSLSEAAKASVSVVTCPGKRWCAHAIVHTNEIADRIRKQCAGMLPPGATVCISGCPNGCSHPAVADIGLSGRMTTDSQGRRVEAFDIRAGGGMGHDDRLAVPVAQKVLTEDVVDEIQKNSSRKPETARMNELILTLRKQTAELPTDAFLKFVWKHFGDKIALASSLSPEDQVITHMLCEIFGEAVERPKVFTIDTGRLPQKTYDVIEATYKKYGLWIKMLFPDAQTVEQMVNNDGPNLFYDSVEARKQCCFVRKVEPLRRELATLDAWVTGLRKQQATTRKDVERIEWDESNGLVKINPLVNWSNDEVWAFIRENNVPYNLLHDKGYPSIGCKPCTRAVRDGEDIRSGRWWWETPEQKECGLHVVDEKLVRKNGD
ncbi:MAG: phosphoadenylyl-sulfate reductase [Phycisphaerae bacterium]|nr:phosphoadenylyl-sulfate reductase [Phycisphaerae bacterium]